MKTIASHMTKPDSLSAISDVLGELKIGEVLAAQLQKQLDSTDSTIQYHLCQLETSLKELESDPTPAASSGGALDGDELDCESITAEGLSQQESKSKTSLASVISRLTFDIDLMKSRLHETKNTLAKALKVQVNTTAPVESETSEAARTMRISALEQLALEQTRSLDRYRQEVKFLQRNLLFNFRQLEKKQAELQLKLTFQKAAFITKNVLSKKSKHASKPVKQFILAPWFFELLSFELVHISKSASCMPILFLLALSKHGHEWMPGIDIWRESCHKSEFQRKNILEFGKKLGCFDVERRRGINGSLHYFFRLKKHVHLVDQDGVNGKLMLWMFAALKKINHERPKQTPRIGLLLFAIFARKLVKRFEIDEYLNNQSVNSAHIIRQVNLLIELNFILEQKEFRSKNSTHFILEILN